MQQRYKIFIKGIPVYLVKEATEEDGFIIEFDGKNSIDEIKMVANLKEPPSAIYMEAGEHEVEEVFEAFKAKYKFVEAGGGLVLNDRNEMLFIFRKDRWDLPKGKTEKGEDILETARREIEEETGVTVTETIKQLSPTYHTYVEEGKDILKANYWYLMRSSVTNNLEPQQDEDIHQVVWVKKEDIDKYLSNTYPAIIDVVKEGLGELKTIQ